MQTVTCPTLQLTPPHHIRNWHSLVCGCLPSTSETGIPLCVDVCQAWDRCTSPTPDKPTPEGSDSNIMPQEDSGLAITQHQASKKATTSPVDICQSIH